MHPGCRQHQTEQRRGMPVARLFALFACMCAGFTEPEQQVHLLLHVCTMSCNFHWIVRRTTGCRSTLSVRGISLHQTCGVCACSDVCATVMQGVQQAHILCAQVAKSCTQCLRNSVSEAGNSESGAERAWYFTPQGDKWDKWEPGSRLSCYSPASGTLALGRTAMTICTKSLFSRVCCVTRFQ